MDAFTKDFTAVIPFWGASLPPLGSLACNLLLFSLTVFAILLVPVSLKTTISFYTASSASIHWSTTTDVLRVS